MRMVIGALSAFLLLLSWSKPLAAQETDAETESSLYIVYLGGKGNKNSDELVEIHNKMIAAVTTSEVDKVPQVIHNYKHGFSGFAARMTKKQADALAGMPEVVKVFPNKILSLHTTRSWEFLSMSDGKLDISNHVKGSSYDVIIGMMDTGFCNNTGLNSLSLTPCRKIIGARAYDSSEPASSPSARDDAGHGSHTASTAAGTLVYNASLSGVATGTARGGLPTARLAIYKVCGEYGCYTMDIMKGYDDSIADGVDILSLSLGGVPENYDEDAIAIGAFHAIEHNITVVCSAGNSGPDEETVSNTAPWIITVAASTMDRAIASQIVLGNNDVLQGTALSFHSQSKPPYPLITGAAAPANKSISSTDASNCVPGSLNTKTVKGHIVLCEFDPNTASRRAITTWLQQYKAAGAILVNDFYADLASYFSFPTTIVKTSVGQKLLSYINNSSSPVATLLPTVAEKTSPAPTVAGFSSRGPNSVSPDIIKPDVTAPGVNVLAAWAGSTPAYYEDYDPNKPVFVKYNIISGTSMSCPHVTGAVAYIKSVHPDWSPAALRSALMTTATFLDNVDEDITDYDGHSSTPFAYGSGQIDPIKALAPGLIYDITPSDYVAYLCATGYDASKIGTITGNKNYTCSKKTANLNYPSIAFPSLSGAVSATRKLTSVESSSSTYKVTVKAPSTLSINVSPESLTFSGYGSKQSYTITVTSSSSTKDWQFASLTWSNGQHSVHSPIAL